MKSIFASALLVCFLACSAYGQEHRIKTDSNFVHYLKFIVETPNTKSINHKNIIDYISLNYKSANDVIQLNSDDKIIAKGLFTIHILGYPHYVSHTVIFDIKDNKIRVNYTQFSVNSNNNENAFENKYHWLHFPNKNKVIQKTEEKLNLMIPDLINSLKNANNDDW